MVEYAYGLPNGRRLAPPLGGLLCPPERRAETMVTYSELIQIGILVVAVIGLFRQKK